MQSRLDRGEMPDQVGHDDVRVGYDKVLGRHDGFIDLGSRIKKEASQQRMPHMFASVLHSSGLP